MPAVHRRAGGRPFRPPGVPSVDVVFEDRSPSEVVAALCRPPEPLPDRDLVAVLVEAAAVVAWAEATGLQALAELRRRRQVAHLQLVAELSAEELGGRPADGDEVDRFVAMEVAAALRMSHRAAVDRVGLARDLTERLPATVAALEVGHVSLHHARALRDATEVLDPAAATAVEADVLPRALRATPAQLAAHARRAAVHLDPEAAARRCALARERRRCTTWAGADSMGVLQLTGPVETVAAAWARVDALARRSQDAARRALGRLDQQAGEGAGDAEAAAGAGADVGGVPTLEQLRADVALRLLAGSHDLTEQPSPAVQVVLDVVVPLGTLLAARQEPGEVAGLGPVPAEVARALAADARWHLVVDTLRARAGAGCQPTSLDGPDADGPDADGLAPPGGHGSSRGCHAHGPTTYRPSEALARAVRARDVTCRFPGCRRAARGCDLDHTVPHPDGPTASCNLACLCRMHHRAKHRAGWVLEQLTDGRLRWTSPAGVVAETEPLGWDP